ncbi:uncharacterized protein DUF262 [Flavobacterium croceum DSM 17960]|uniref:Uncharacterized protein DUF262 n=1 Tax=Flavobacterium croceum DSM 17960 TaxID=1121886 RepID=A0A2S4N8T8_9FLAO|nr:DUF262 domain-containing protein [Flavobacterium croceum]POS02116.1 uncharacterized protein DUF262 [Flavobacterium croceum DSM 17960]
MNINYTLLDILTNNVKVFNKDNGAFEPIMITNGIEIPMIQRDYAQGRLNDKTKFIRQQFLKDIYEVLKCNQDGKLKLLNLDFVYGFIENESFIPLDGQQRLTTLYIIHWFLAFKDDIDFKRYGLQLFNYKTRQSAKEFLKSINIVDNQIKLKKECNNDFKKLSESIKNQPWYNLKWNDDPTVKGFLQTLQDTIPLFSDIYFTTLVENKPLCFNFLKIDEYGLGDNLYIKMNARGKSLSDFENFKASFENIISKNKATSEDFIKKIDGVWLDAFWGYALKSLPELEVNENVENLTKKCDFLLLEFIKKITEYLYFKDDIGNNFEFTNVNLERIYSSEENIRLLIKFFELIAPNEYSKWDLYFDEIFSEKHRYNRVAINQSELNFIMKIFKGESFSHFENLLFFGWLNFIFRNEKTEVSDDLRDFLRIIRNFINNINQKNKTELNTELRTDYYHDIIDTIQNLEIVNPYANLISKEFSNRQRYIDYEIIKYEIFKSDSFKKELLFKFEDHGALRGLIFNFDFEVYNSNEIKNIVTNFYGMFNHLEYQDIIRLILCFGNYSVKVGYSNLGEFRFFGQKQKWHRILASPDGEIKDNFRELFKVFSKEEITNWNDFVEKMVSNNISQYNGDWLWYCMQPKYKSILDHPIYTKDYNGRIEIFYNQSLNSYHHNPFAFWFRYHSPIEIRNTINEAESCAQYSNFSRLHLKNGLQLEQIDSTWQIYNLNEDFKSEIIFYDEIKDCFVLKCENLVEDLISQINVLYKSKVTLNQ